MMKMKRFVERRICVGELVILRNAFFANLFRKYEPVVIYYSCRDQIAESSSRVQFNLEGAGTCDTPFNEFSS